MQTSIKFILTIIFASIAVNIFIGRMGFNYFWTIVAGMGLPTLIVWFMGRKNLDLSAWKSFITFNLFSIVISTIIEVIMLNYDTWGFSKAHGRFIGVNFIGAPIEEYIYWWIAPILVGMLYITLRKITQIDPVPPGIESSVEYLGYIGSAFMKSSNSADATPYLENDGVIVQNGSYVRGTSIFPTWMWIQILVVLVIFYLKKYFKGNWLTVFAVSGIFACVAFIGELHAIDYGFWVYNKQRVIGIFFFNIPIEQYPMYFLSAIFECVVIDIVGRKHFKMG